MSYEINITKQAETERIPIGIEKLEPKHVKGVETLLSGKSLAIYGPYSTTELQTYLEDGADIMDTSIFGAVAVAGHNPTYHPIVGIILAKETPEGATAIGLVCSLHYNSEIIAGKLQNHLVNTTNETVDLDSLQI